LPQEADPEIEAAQRFYGKLTDGKVYYRGIELRRHDYPPFLKKFQEKLLNIILEADSPSDILRTRVREATAYTQETVEKVLSGHLETSELDMKAAIDVDGKKAIVNTGTDKKILEAGDRAGTDKWYESTRGTDLMVHVTKNKRTVFYLYHWTRWQGEADTIEAVTKEQALDWLMEHYHFADESDIEAAAEYGLEVHETA